MCTISCVRRWSLRLLPLLALACATAAPAPAPPPREQPYWLLQCGRQSESIAEAVAETSGDMLSVRGHALRLPRGTLAAPQRFRVADRTDGYVGVDIEPHGFHFARPATLVLSYARCDTLPKPASELRIYEVDTGGTRFIRELPSHVDTVARTVRTDSLNHLSGYLIGGT